MELVLAPEGLIQLVLLLTDSGRGRLPPCAPLSPGAEPAGWIAAAGDAVVPPEGAGVEDPAGWIAAAGDAVVPPEGAGVEDPAGWIAAAGDAVVPPEGTGAERGGAARAGVEDPPP